MWRTIKENFDRGSITVAGVTFILFAMALFIKGFTHDLLLEAAVFLVSVKLIIATYKLSVMSRHIEKKIDETNEMLKEILKK